MTLKIKDRSRGVEITYGNNSRFLISSELLEIVHEVEATIASDAPNRNDVLIREAKACIVDDMQQLLELAVYGRVILGMHPKDLTHVSCGVSPDKAAPYRSISMQFAKKREHKAAISRRV